jgi:uncharacterized membrane protein (DUF2068 family)
MWRKNCAARDPLASGRRDLKKSRPVKLRTDEYSPMDQPLKCSLAKASPMAEGEKYASARQSAPTLYLIIADKLFKAFLSLLIAFGVYKMAGIDVLGLFDRLVYWMHFDPENRFLTDVGNLIDEITRSNMRWVATSSLLYGLLSLIEGVGLPFRATWANWLAIGESAFFIPIEIFELTRHRLHQSGPEFLSHRNIGLLIVLACNILIFWYLYANRRRLFTHNA